MPGVTLSKARRNARRKDVVVPSPERLSAHPEAELSVVREPPEAPGPDRPGADADRSEATRYLCAGVHLDPAFRDRVLADVLHQPGRAVAPSHGIDLAPVLRHALAARRRVLVRDVTIAIVFALVLVLSFWEVLFVALAVYAVLSLGRFFRHLLTGASNQMMVDLIVFLVSGTLATVMVLIQRESEGDSYYPRPAGSFLADIPGLGLFAGVTVVLWVILLAERIAARQTLVDRLRPDRFDPDDAPREGLGLRRRLRYLQTAQDGNVTVYAQTSARNPFVGAGALERAWPLSVPLHPLPGAGPAALDAGTVHEAIRDALAGLVPAGAGRARVPGLSLQDRIFVMGLLPPGHPFLDAERLPLHRLPAAVVADIAERELVRERHYLRLRIAPRDADAEAALFVHVGLSGDLLAVEFVTTFLPAVRARYRAVDGYPAVDGGFLARSVARAFLDVFRVAPVAPLRLVEPALAALVRRFDDRRRPSLDEDGGLDCGARTSVRELGAGWDEGTFFQRFDAARYIGLVERRAIEEIGETLRQAGYDPAEFLRRAATMSDQSLAASAGGRDGSGPSAPVVVPVQELPVMPR